MKDYYTLENSFLGNIGQPTPAVMSFTVVWNATGSADDYDNPAQKFRGDFRKALGQSSTRDALAIFSSSRLLLPARRPSPQRLVGRATARSTKRCQSEAPQGAFLPQGRTRG